MGTTGTSNIPTWGSQWMWDRQMLMSQMQCPGFWKQVVWLLDQDKTLSRWWTWSPLGLDGGQASSIPNPMTVAESSSTLSLTGGVWVQLLSGPLTDVQLLQRIQVLPIRVSIWRTEISRGGDWPDMVCGSTPKPFVKSRVKKKSVSVWNPICEGKVLLGNLLPRPLKKKSSLLGNWFTKWKCTNIVIQYSFYLREWVGEKRGREQGEEGLECSVDHNHCGV